MRKAPGERRMGKDIGRNVTALREKAGLSRPGLADKLRVDRTYVWRIEQGEVVPSLRVLDRMCALFGVTLDGLRGRRAA